MNLPTTVAQAILSEELAKLQPSLQWREDDIRLTAAEALMEGRDEEVPGLLRTIQELKAIRVSLRAPTQCPAHALPKLPSTLPPGTPEAPDQSRHFGLRVLLNGIKIEGSTDACTFADAIQMIGCEKVAALSLVANYCSLVSKERQKPAYGGYQRRMQLRQRDGWYIVTHSSTQRKVETLRAIARRLQVDLIVETEWGS